jgi:hypothetical protein
MGVSFKRRGVKYDATVQDRIRQKIADAEVAKGLIAHYKGELNLSPTQVTVGLALLKKVVPDLQSSELTIEHAQPFAVLPAVMEGETSWEQAFTPGKTEH